MYRTVPTYGSSQELATRFWWGLTQLAAAAAYDVFLIIYSALDNTDNGKLSIQQYCKNTGKSNVCLEISDQGYNTEKVNVNPHEVSFVDLNLTRLLVEKLLGDGKNTENWYKLKRHMRNLVYWRNDLSHEELEPLNFTELKSKINRLKQTLQGLYKLAGKLSLRTQAEMKRAVKPFIIELDILLRRSRQEEASDLSSEENWKSTFPPGKGKESDDVVVYQSWVSLKNIRSCENISENEFSFANGLEDISYSGIDYENSLPFGNIHEDIFFSGNDHDNSLPSGNGQEDIFFSRNDYENSLLSRNVQERMFFPGNIVIPGQYENILTDTEDEYTQKEITHGKDLKKEQMLFVLRFFIVPLLLLLLYAWRLSYIITCVIAFLVKIGIIKMIDLGKTEAISIIDLTMAEAIKTMALVKTVAINASLQFLELLSLWKNYVCAQRRMVRF